MGVLSKAFDRIKPLSISRADLADIVAPFMELPEDKAPTMAEIAHGWEEASAWLTIGFDIESDKGQSFKALERVMRIITGKLKALPESAQALILPREDLAILKSCAFQMQQAAHNLESIFSQMHRGPRRMTYTNPSGIIEFHDDYSHTIPVWDRPNADHALMGQNLAECYQRLENVLRALPVGEAGHRAVADYVPQPRSRGFGM